MNGSPSSIYCNGTTEVCLGVEAAYPAQHCARVYAPAEPAHRSAPKSRGPILWAAMIAGMLIGGVAVAMVR